MPLALVHTAPARPDWDRHGRVAAAARPSGVVRANATPDAAARDAGFAALQAAYRGHGGIARGESLAACLGRAGRGGFLDLVRRIVAGELFSFRWHDTFWVPLFQFDPVGLTPRVPPRRVLDELRGVFGGWDIAHWYVRSRDDLGGRRPLDLLDLEPGAVLAAARADRHAAGA